MRFCNAAKEETEDFPEYPEDQYPNDKDYEHLENKRIEAIREKYQIPEGVHLMGECAINDWDISVFMKFAKWWVNGEMNDEIFDVFIFHFCEVVEVDFYWVLMEESGNYYGLGLKEKDEDDIDVELCGFKRLEPELKRIGTRSKKKAKMNFMLHFGHGFA